MCHPIPIFYIIAINKDFLNVKTIVFEWIIGKVGEYLNCIM